MTIVEGKTRWTQAELTAEAQRRFGDDWKKWAFVCPRCHDVATAQDFKDADAEPNRIGQECIGRSLGALKGPAATKGGKGQADRGCDWAAYGLFHGPWTIVIPAEGDKPEHDAYSFALAEVDHA